MSIIKRLRRWWRSAVTGHFVSKSYAEANPDTTIGEREDAAQLAARLKKEHRP